MPDQRSTPREGTIDREVRAIARRPDGVELEGRVADVSLGGARITGPTNGLTVGEEIRLAFVFLTDERVEYRARVKHVDLDGQFFGVEFTSEPTPIKVRES